MSDKIRLFAAVNLSVATTRKIADAVARMKGVAAQKGLRVTWVAPTNWHVTLRFFGWTRAETVGAIRDHLQAIAAGRKGFELVARGAGGFPKDDRARVLWIGLDAQPALAQIAAEVEKAAQALGFEKEPHPFNPHVTVGRVKEGSGTGEVLAPHQKTEFGSSLVREIVLYQSVMKSTGSEYAALFRAPLDAPPYRAERQTREVEEGTKESEEPDGGQQST